MSLQANQSASEYCRPLSVPDRISKASPHKDQFQPNHHCISPAQRLRLSVPSKQLNTARSPDRGQTSAPPGTDTITCRGDVRARKSEFA